MPRPIRIEYGDACYHVMNRGRARQKIFHGDAYYDAFLLALEEAHTRFGVQFLCYCLMSNHYHLLVKTPEANLGRAMRHINGVYTQRYNRLRKRDGALFRGRYNAIVVEEGAYQLHLSRYIHSNPLDARLVSTLEDYPWSSYPSYIGKAKPARWLYRDDIYAQLGLKSRLKARYKAYVGAGVDEETRQFYCKGNLKPYLGSDTFRDWVYQQRQTQDDAVSRQALRGFRPGLGEITDRVSQVFAVDEKSILKNRRGVVENNVPRWVAMYISRDIGGHTLAQIAGHFGLKTTGSISNTIGKLHIDMKKDKKLAGKVAILKRDYDT